MTLARTLAPALGSFLQPDPVKRIPSEAAQDCSIYTYCGSDPVNLKDLDGRQSQALEPASAVCPGPEGIIADISGQVAGDDYSRDYSCPPTARSASIRRSTYGK
jgi:hypothetical protein